ncbi:hypothetical protein KQI21_13920 [Virgibacillus proomii]|nr:hypothetical protein [Virgibacillus proomii]
MSRIRGFIRPKSYQEVKLETGLIPVRLEYLLSEVFDIEGMQRIHNTKRNRYLPEIIAKKRWLD